jgi:FtsH-binding integral membrane protein
MFNYPRNNGPYGNPYGGNRGGGFSSRYQYQTLPYGYQANPAQSSSLISKVMTLMAFSFVFASIGAFLGYYVLHLTYQSYFLVAIAGFIVLFALNFLIQKPGLNLVLLYGFTFLEGMSLSPLLSVYVGAGMGNLLGQAFVITALVSFGLAIYAWTTKRDFSHLGDYLFFGLLLLIVASLMLFFFHSTLMVLLISVVGVAIFSGYVLFYVQRAKYMADTLPNAIGLTVSLFITVLNLFIYILQILTILSGGRRQN